MTTPMSRTGRSTAFVFALLLVAQGAAGCATTSGSSADAQAAPGPTPSAGHSSTFADYPVDENPRLAIRWRRNVGVDGLQKFQPREYAKPVLWRRSNRYDVITSTRAGHIAELRAGDGHLRWDAYLEEPVHAAPAVTRSRVFVGTIAGNLVALDRKSGDELWRISRSHGISSQPAVTDQAVLFVTNNDALVAVSPEDGSELWSFERSTPQEFTVKGAGSPVVRDGIVYCGFSDGSLVALDVASGRRIWLADLSGGEAEYADIIAPIVVREDKIFAASYASGVYALEPSSGDVLWSRSLENVSSMETAGLSMYVTLATGRVLALSSEDGSSLWGFQFEEYLPVEATQAGPFLFVSTGSGPLYLLSRSSGHPLMRWDPSSGFNTPAVFTENRGFVLSNRGFLYAFDVAW